jgi:hypothetical protein
MHVDPARPAPDDPRLPPLVRAALRKERLDPSWADTVEQLATGAIGPGALHCCGSGCRPCVKELEACAQVVIQACADPALADELTRARGLRARAKGFAGRLAGALGRRRG